MPGWTYPTVIRRPQPADPNDLCGEDIAVRQGYEVGPNGDWKTVRGEHAAVQSVRREHLANPGALVRRPEWGVGTPAMIFKSNNRANRDALLTQSQRRLSVNPRVSKVTDVRIEALEDNPSGNALIVQFTPRGIQKPVTTVIKPGGE